MHNECIFVSWVPSPREKKNGKALNKKKTNRKYTKKMYTPCTTIVFVNGDHSSINLFSSNFSHNSQSSLNLSNKQHRAGQRWWRHITKRTSKFIKYIHFTQQTQQYCSSKILYLFICLEAVTLYKVGNRKNIYVFVFSIFSTDIKKFVQSVCTFANSALMKFQINFSDVTVGLWKNLGYQWSSASYSFLYFRLVEQSSYCLLRSHQDQVCKEEFFSLSSESFMLTVTVNIWKDKCSFTLNLFS